MSVGKWVRLVILGCWTWNVVAIMLVLGGCVLVSGVITYGEEWDFG